VYQRLAVLLNSPLQHGGQQMSSTNKPNQILPTKEAGRGTGVRSVLLHEDTAAKMLAVSPAWLQRKRWEGGGPAYVRHGRAIRYEVSAIEKWIETHRIDPEARSK
jgi:hypothetical protein